MIILEGAYYNVAGAAGGDSRCGMLLRLRGAEGLTSYSELAPLPEPGFSRESLDEVSAALKNLAKLEVPESPKALDKDLSRRIPSELPSLCWALEILLAGYAAECQAISLAEWYAGAPVQRNLALNAFLPPGSSIAALRELSGAGFGSIKLKVSPELLEPTITLTQQAGDLNEAAMIRIDANRSLSLLAATTLCERLKDSSTLEYLEEPLQAPTLDTLRALRVARGVRIALDETLWCDSELAAQACREKLVHTLVLKPCMLGGFFGCKRIIEAYAAETVAVTSTMEVGPAYAAGIHASLALGATVSLLPCGFDTLKVFREVYIPDAFRPQRGYCSIGDRPGLGIDFSTTTAHLPWQVICAWPA